MVAIKSVSHGIFYGSSIVVAIRSLDPTLGLLETGAQGALSQSLFIPLIAPYKCTFQTGSKSNTNHSLLLMYDSLVQNLLPPQTAPRLPHRG